MAIIMIRKATQELIDRIVDSLTSTDKESGGILGSSNGKIIDTFWFDEGTNCTAREYNPSIELWEQQLRIWNDNQIEFCGIIHSHFEQETISTKDIYMARRILDMNSMRSLFMPILYMRTRNIIWYEVGVNTLNRVNIEIL